MLAKFYNYITGNLEPRKSDNLDFYGNEITENTSRSPLDGVSKKDLKESTERFKEFEANRHARTGAFQANQPSSQETTTTPSKDSSRLSGTMQFLLATAALVSPAAISQLAGSTAIGGPNTRANLGAPATKAPYITNTPIPPAKAAPESIVQESKQATVTNQQKSVLSDRKASTTSQAPIFILAAEDGVAQVAHLPNSFNREQSLNTGYQTKNGTFDLHETDPRKLETFSGEDGPSSKGTNKASALISSTNPAEYSVHYVPSANGVEGYKSYQTMFSNLLKMDFLSPETANRRSIFISGVDSASGAQYFPFAAIIEDLQKKGTVFVVPAVDTYLIPGLNDFAGTISAAFYPPYGSTTRPLISTGRGYNQIYDVKGDIVDVIQDTDGYAAIELAKTIREMLIANPSLTTTDIENILAYTASSNIDGPESAYNGADINGGLGISSSIYTGAGILDSNRAITVAKYWRSSGEEKCRKFYPMEPHGGVTYGKENIFPIPLQNDFYMITRVGYTIPLEALTSEDRRDEDWKLIYNLTGNNITDTFLARVADYNKNSELKIQNTVSFRYLRAPKPGEEPLKFLIANYYHVTPPFGGGYITSIGPEIEICGIAEEASNTVRLNQNSAYAKDGKIKVILSTTKPTILDLTAVNNAYLTKITDVDGKPKFVGIINKSIGEDGTVYSAGQEITISGGEITEVILGDLVMLPDGTTPPYGLTLGDNVLYSGNLTFAPKVLTTVAPTTTNQPTTLTTQEPVTTQKPEEPSYAEKHKKEIIAETAAGAAALAALGLALYRRHKQRQTQQPPHEADASNGTLTPPNASDNPTTIEMASDDSNPPSRQGSELSLLRGIKPPSESFTREVAEKQESNEMAPHRS